MLQLVKEALCSFGEEIPTQDFNIYNTNAANSEISKL